MSGAEVLRIVLRDFGLVSHEDLRRGALATADVPQLLDTLEGFLQSLVPLGSYAVIVMDEAQSLAPAVLDQIRLLTALEHNRQRLVQVVLCGQPGLLQTIKAEPLHALNERITRRVDLAPLPADEIQRLHRPSSRRGRRRRRRQFRRGAASRSASCRAACRGASTCSAIGRCRKDASRGQRHHARLVKRAARALAGVHDPTPVAPARTGDSPGPAAGPESSDGLAAAAMAAAAAPDGDDDGRANGN